MTDQPALPDQPATLAKLDKPVFKAPQATPVKPVKQVIRVL
jgi:hypothetical protein